LVSDFQQQIVVPPVPFGASIQKRLVPKSKVSRLLLEKLHGAVNVRFARIPVIPRPRSDISNRPAASPWRKGFKVSKLEKLAPILAADIIAFSRLIGADEDRTLPSQPSY